ncbi:MAG: sigma-54 dependent transcriptional regulator [Acidobacteriaceae bacterium]|nr:sigma-54 dependent transcriptional regulator [Acidobacteriaceae bacterium]
MALSMRGNKSVILASVDVALRERLRSSLSGMRWSVREAAGGAEVMAYMEQLRAEALLMDSWLPDLEVKEFTGQMRMLYPELDLLRLDGDPVEGATRSPLRHELLHALREATESIEPLRILSSLPAVMDGPAWASAPQAVPMVKRLLTPRVAQPLVEQNALPFQSASVREELPAEVPARQANRPPVALIPELVGTTPVMQELTRMIHLVSPRSATVLIEGETGTGKEVVAQAVHRLSARAQKPFVVLNCAAIPEALLEAELFGHTRGAFTGAVNSRTGRIEAANGGTLFLDEIGEMPLALQAKMLRFLECGELQRVGDNELVRVDVRVIAATHQDLETSSAEGRFRLDLYHRLAVFPLEVPSLRERPEDVALLSEHFLEKLGKSSPQKRLTEEALAVLREHQWPGNVRELAHVLERATILAGERSEIYGEDIRYRRKPR